MKNPNLAHDRGSKRGPRGFALVITITLMVLLSLLAVGLLGLSTISLRTSSQTGAMAEARANARLGLMIALGEIQGQLGKDQRISAPATLNDGSAPRHLTGVWEGGHATSDQPVIDSQNRFVGYLGSGSESEPTSLPASGDVTLLGDASLGGSPNPDEVVAANRINIATGGNASGRYAWTALDESVKARANLVREEFEELDYPAHAMMGSASRFGLERIEELEDYDWFNGTEHGRALTLPTAGLVSNLPDLGSHQHDLTMVSRGLLTDPARGGLKKDLSRLLDSLPASYENSRLYDDPAVTDAENNPYWSHLAHYHNLYQSLDNGPGGYGITARLPEGGGPAYDRRARAHNKPQTPRETPLMPVVARVQLQFSLVAQEAHSNWGAGQIMDATNDPQRNYMLYMIYSPVVTLYNPYNVELTVNQLRAELEDIPIGFKFFRNGQPQTTDFAHLNHLYVYASDRQTPKAFGLNLRSSLSGGGPITLAPGEARIFGESIPGDHSFANGSMFDWRDDLTADVSLAPGFAKGMGFWVDWLTPDGMRTAHDDGLGVLSLRARDTVNVEFKPMPSQESGNKFQVKLFDSENPGGRTTPIGIFDMDYSDARTLEDSLAAGSESGSAFPKSATRPIDVSKILQSQTTPVRSSRAEPFAIFSFEAKTTLDSNTPSKPWVRGGHAGNMAVVNLRSEKLDHHTREMTLRQWNANSVIESEGDRAFFFTSGNGLTGVLSAPQYEIPSMPLQSIAQLRHAQLAPAGFLGGATYTAGESFASPLIPGNRVTSAGRDYQLLDHRWLTNNTLWDQYFFSTIAPHTGRAMGSNRSAEDVARRFLESEDNLLNQRLKPASPIAPEDAAAEITSDEGHLKSARHMVVEGPFNVNSLSLEAWKSLLSSLNEESVAYFDGSSGAGQAGVEDQARNPFSRMRRATGPPLEEAGAGQDSRRARWNGFRSLEDGQIEALAREIVEEIRERGPFHSLADFINRRPGGETEQALKGALQAAIDRTAINEAFRDDSEIYTVGSLQDSEYEFPDAMTGMNAVGAPGYLTQGDILSSVGQILTVRADTFRVRAYGESLTDSGQVAARAWCEAVVQRTPEYVDPVDQADQVPTSPANERFGRRFVVSDFRWLASEEI